MSECSGLCPSPQTTTSVQSRRPFVLCVIILVVACVVVMWLRLYTRKLAVDELTHLFNTSGFAVVEAEWPWSLLKVTGLNEKWYFTDCFVQLWSDDDEGAFLKRMTDRAATVVTTLHAGSISYDDENLSHVSRMTNVTEIAIYNSFVSDKWIATLKRGELRSLRALVIQSDGITDAGVRQMSLIPQLEELDLSYSENVTDSSIPALSHGINLRRLSVVGTRISDAGFAALKKALPRCSSIER